MRPGTSLLTEAPLPNLITPQNLGAWLIKCDPDNVFDLKQFMEDGNDWISSWSVVDNYRSHTMKAGDKVILWVSGTGENVEKGIWGAGYVTGRVQDPDPEDLNGTELGYWLDRDAMESVEYAVPLAVQLFDQPVTPADLKLAGITDLEVQKMPGGSNPSWVTRERLQDLDPIVGGWDDYDPWSVLLSIDPDEVRILDDFDPAILTAAAFAAVLNYYEGWDVEVAELEDRWDARFTDPQTENSVHVRIKGLRGSEQTVMLTPAELESARETAGWHLAVVTHALTNPAVYEYPAEALLAKAEAHVYRADLGADLDVSA